MNTIGFIISFVFLVFSIATLWGVLSYDGDVTEKKEAIKSGFYAFSAISGISITLALLILMLSK